MAPLVATGRLLWLGVLAWFALAAGVVADSSGQNMDCKQTSSYTAAVVELSPEYENRLSTPNGPSSFSTPTYVAPSVNGTLDNYEHFVRLAKQGGAQIVVFPEYGLYGDMFDTRNQILPYLETIPQPGALPCAESADNPKLLITHRLSCMARDNSIIVVANMGDLQPCSTECPFDHRLQFNTNVAFNETGHIVAKYHKTHLYFERHIFDAGTDGAVFFDTSFGVRFGMLICFDIMFEQPSKQLLHQHKVHDFIFSSMWVNKRPATSVQMQAAWSNTHQVNLLASGHGSGAYNSGSGIFARGKTLASYYNSGNKPFAKLLVAKVPIIACSTAPVSAPQFLEPSARVLSNPLPELAVPSPYGATSASTLSFAAERTSFVLSAHSFDNANVTSISVDTKPGAEAKQSVTAGPVDCVLTYRISASSSAEPEVYRLMAVAGSFWGMPYAELCVLIKCASNTASDPCEAGQAITTRVVFNEFSLTGVMSTSRRYGLIAGDSLSLVRQERYQITQAPAVPLDVCLPRPELPGKKNYYCSRSSTCISNAQGVAYDSTVLNVAVLGLHL